MILEKAIQLSEAIEAKATAGPWFVNNEQDISNENGMLMWSQAYGQKDVLDAEFIAHARNTLAKFRESSRVLMEAMEKIESTDCDKKDRRYCCQFSQWAADAIKAVERIWSDAK